MKLRLQFVEKFVTVMYGLRRLEEINKDLAM